MQRNTHQKQKVLDVLKALRGDHPTAETVFEYVSKEIPSISRATVYRILRQFAHDGTITQMHIPESADRYDDLMSQHYHLLCNSCRDVIDLMDIDFKKIKLPQGDLGGCKITGIEFTFLGVCSRCAKKKKTKK